MIWNNRSNFHLILYNWLYKTRQRYHIMNALRQITTSKCIIYESLSRELFCNFENNFQKDSSAARYLMSMESWTDLYPNPGPDFTERMGICPAAFSPGLAFLADDWESICRMKSSFVRNFLKIVTPIYWVCTKYKHYMCVLFLFLTIVLNVSPKQWFSG